MEIKPQPWVRDIVRAGGKIGANCWETWQGMVDRFSMNVVIKGIEGTNPDKRFADHVEAQIQRSGASQSENEVIF